jgi:AcrR family transcriptional regulator
VVDRVSADAARPLRADARRNRARVLDAAEEVFAAQGTGASTEEIARRAGVGIGTVFRHFPTKEALLEAVFVGRLHRLAEQAAALADAADPGTAFFDFFHRVVDHAATKNAIADALAEAGVAIPGESSTVGLELQRALAVLLERAQAAGAVRPDVGVAELKALLVGASRAVELTPEPGVRARTLRVMLDGLRPPAPGRSPGTG